MQSKKWVGACYAIHSSLEFYKNCCVKLSNKSSNKNLKNFLKNLILLESKITSIEWISQNYLVVAIEDWNHENPQLTKEQNHRSAQECKAKRSNGFATSIISFYGSSLISPSFQQLYYVYNITRWKKWYYKSDCWRSTHGVQVKGQYERLPCGYDIWFLLVFIWF